MESRQVIGEAVVYIENHLYEPLTASMVADAVSYSYYHFHRYFLAVMGETIGSYIRSRRLTLAAYELVHSRKKILDIGISLYFESAENFSRAFKKKYGMTPKAYRMNGRDILIANHPDLSQGEQDLNYGSLVPEIVEVNTTWIMGISFHMSVQDNPSLSMWETFNERLLVQKEIPLNRPRYSLYEAETACKTSTFSEQSEATTYIGIEVDEKNISSRLPEGMQAKMIEGGKYARFIHKGKVQSLAAAYRYIWGVWFPQSGYKLTEKSDFERYTEKFLGADDPRSEIEIYFPIL